MSDKIKVGFGRADITPEEYGPMGGFGNDDVRICTEILDRLFGTCILVKDSAGEAFVLCTTDLLNPKETTVVATCREAVSAVTGYSLEGNFSGSCAGYKDWAMDELEIPSLTIEIGVGDSPLSLRECYSIFMRNQKILPAIADWLQN